MALSLKQIVNVSTNLQPIAAARRGFNVALIVGTSTVVPKAERVRIYTSADAMLEDGFTAKSAEYRAALLYFGAKIAPRKLAVGCKYADDSDMLAAVRACRAANSEWYVVIPLAATDEDLQAIAAWAESAEPDTVLAYTTSDEHNLRKDVSADAGTDVDGIFKKLQAKSYLRSIGLYCGQEDTPDAVAALVGYAMGANRGTNNSAYTLAYKSMPGVTPDDLTEAEVQYVCGDSETSGVGGNVYVQRAGTYNVVQQGIMANGAHFDEVLYLDMLKDRITLAIMDLLVSVAKVPGTEPGVASIVNRINGACDDFVNTGFIAPGVWKGGTVLDLEDGTTLPKGYLVLSEPVADQAQDKRDKRVAPSIYVCIKTAGAFEWITINVNVNR